LFPWAFVSSHRGRRRSCCPPRMLLSSEFSLPLVLLIISLISVTPAAAVRRFVTLSTLSTMLTNAHGQYLAPDLVRRQSPTLGPGPASFDPSPTDSSSSSPSQTATLILPKPPQMTTCQSATITWLYSGPSPAQLTLQLTDIDLNLNQSTTPTLMTLSDNIDATALNWTWEQVDVPSGRYILEGAVLDANTTSNSFFVANGSDTSCLQSIPTTSTPTPSQMPPPTSKNTHAAAIAGGIVGGAVLLSVLLGALFLWRKNRQLRSRRGAAVGRWGGLGSNASSGGDPFTRDKALHGPSESMGGMLHDISPAAAGGGNTVTASSRDDFDSVLDSEEKFSSPISPRPDSMVILPYSPTHRRGSSSTAFERHSDIPLPPIDTRAYDPRRRSLDSPTTTTAAAADYRHSPGSSPPSTKISSRKPSAEMIPMDRSASGKRRSSRKPVPQYDDDDAADMQQQSHNVPLPSSEPATTDFGSTPKHKLSSGDVRPVHYLIPDMPQTPNT
jgi:hypothetical protein